MSNAVSRVGLVEQALRFLWQQTKELRQGGLPALLRKSVDALGLCLAVLPVLSVIALRPLVLVRFGYLISSRIGHLARNTELYLCERDVETSSPRTLDIFFHTSPICNQQLKKMWDRTLHVSYLARWPYRLLHRFPGLKSHIISLPSDRDLQGLLPRTPTHLAFTPKEENMGRAALEDMGITEGLSFICFHARDSGYLKTILPSNDWSGHDYRDADIQSYIPAAEELTRRGQFAIRIGAVVKEALNMDNPMVIDYATSGRTDFLDIYLSAKCRFILCAPSGIDATPTIFRRPVAYVNVVPLEVSASWGPDDLLIHKKLWSRKEERFLTFPEIMETGTGAFFDSELYEQNGIDIVDNTAEEITALVVEMDDRLKGTWQSSEEDQELQARFWSIFEGSSWHGKIASRTGTEFLRQNRHLLDWPA